MDEVRGVIGQEATPPSAENILIMSQLFFLILSNTPVSHEDREGRGRPREGGRIEESAFLERAAPRGNLCTS